jgi:hypothetical protein
MKRLISRFCRSAPSVQPQSAKHNVAVRETTLLTILNQVREQCGIADIGRDCSRPISSRTVLASGQKSLSKSGNVAILFRNAH